MTASRSTAARRWLTALAAVVAGFAFAAPSALAAGTFTGGLIANDAPLFVANDHSVTAVRFTAAPSADPQTLLPDTTYYVKVRFSPSSSPQGASNRGFTWNEASGKWAQERGEWADFPTVTTNASGQIAQSPWLYVKFGDETKSGTYYMLVSLSTGASGSTLNGTVTPAVTVLDMTAASGGGSWVHNGIATGQTGAKRADAVAAGLTDIWALQRTEPNKCDDDANGVVDDEDYGTAGATGDFRLGVPAEQAFDARLQSTVWPPTALAFTVGAADVDIAYGAADQVPPTAATGLTADASADKVDLAWSPSTDLGGSTLAGYVVYRWTDPLPIGGATAYTAAPAVIGVTGETSYADTAVVVGTTYHYVVRPVDVATNYGPRSNTVSATPKEGSIATLAPVKNIVPWLGDAELAWRITDAAHADLMDAVGHLERSTDKGVTWTAVTDVRVDAYTTWTVIATPDLRRRTWYRLRYDGDAHHMAATSDTVQIAPKVQLARTTAPKSVRRGAKFLAYGTLKPRHAAGARTVRLRCYQRVSGSWKLKKTVYAKNVNKSGYTQYRVKFALPTTGKWKLVAYHPNDAEHAVTTSAARYVTVK